MENSTSGDSQLKYVLFVFLLFSTGLKDVASKQMAADNIPQMKYDVFVSFRGEDIRQGFLGHLTQGFNQKQINAFVDDKLKKGDDIWPSLVAAIQESLILLTIFSENYASSRWCLEELVTILEYRDRYNRTLIPVFYSVNPTDVRHQKGIYGKAFAEHEKKYNMTKVQNWRHALMKAADLSGIKSFDYRSEVELLEEIINIVNLVLTSLDKLPPKSERLVGIDKHIQHLESLLHQEPNYVRVIGIWGMGGIGKTTIAEEIFNKLHSESEYDGYYYLANAKEELSRQGIIYMKMKLFSELLGKDVKMDTVPRFSNYTRRRMSRMKVLIVLDDVNDLDLLNKLFGNHNWFGSGSRIIITTRDKQVLVANKVDHVYEVESLNPGEALELFNMHAFKQNHFDMEYYELSKRVVNYAKGIPFVLKVLGLLLCGKDKQVWESQLDKLRSMPNRDVYNAMRLSYDDLDRKEQKILLDLACFLVELRLRVDSIKFLLRDNERDDSVVAVLEGLKDKALITVSKYNEVSMHDIIQEMAREIVRQESIEEPGSRSRLTDPDEVYEVLKYNKGTETVRSIRADLSPNQKLQLSPDVFTKMRKLEFLSFRKYNPLLPRGLESFPANMHGYPLLPRGLESFPTELRCLVWWGYPLHYLPDNFSAENLVILDLSYSQLVKLWDGVQNLMNLKLLQVAGSRSFKELPDLSKAKNLAALDIGNCSRLTSLDPSVFSLDKLEGLYLDHCSLTKLVSNKHLSSLRFLNLRRCEILKEFSVTSENMIQLDLSFTSVSALPSSFGRQSNLLILRLEFTDIESLPSSFKNLTGLLLLNVEGCKKLHTLAELPASLGYLDATNCTALKTVFFPSIAEQFKENRSDILFWDCLELDEHSLNAIVLNARINVMKSAYHNNSYRVNYIYPGSSIPGWLEHKTTTDYITIDLSSTPPSTLLGFIFGFVIAAGPKDQSRASLAAFGNSFYITVIEGEDESEKYGIDIYVSLIKMVESGVCVIYDPRCSHYLHSRVRNQTRLKIKVATKVVGPSDSKRGVELKGFGVTLVTTSLYHNFTKEINTSTYHSSIQQMNTFADHSLIHHQLNISVDHTFIQQINTSANHSFIQQINTSADHNFTQQVNFSADNIFIHQMEVSNSMLFIPILAIIIFLMSIWFLFLRRRY